jgi:hypothetical protein
MPDNAEEPHIDDEISSDADVPEESNLEETKKEEEKLDFTSEGEARLGTYLSTRLGFWRYV